ncbi:V-type ATPase 116kDa subunit family protein [Treponema vincentii ATCC 35580]|uniref:V-type ATPase 116kDa subunit family protein n=1 Tax=Treponema vincentii ATCC 35580 TaxID=596324 RepID=C8PMZ6_9SPIR|nr:ATP synthase subunit I [Treponema vincentii]EEV21139.1 V-type ATPase 116kDa subunit family protein [Treponema vincentii ATCC 35580]
MILPMKKITLLVLDSQKKAALKTLRNFGAVHVEKETASSDTLTELQTVYARLQQAESLITEAQPKKGAKQPEAAALNRHDLLEAVDGILDLKDQESNTLAAINKLTGDIEAYSSWGDFNPEDIRGFEENGIYLTMGELSEKSYAALPETVKTVRLVGGKKTVRFAIVSETADVPTDLPSDFTPLILPEMRLSAMKAEKERLQKRLPSFKARIGARTDLLAPLKAEKKKFEKEIEFETVHAGMAIIPLEDECDTENSAENTAASAVNVQAHSAAGTPCAQKEPRRLARLSGYILAEKQADFAGLAKANGWAFISDDPAEEDAVPTAMRHNRFVQLLTPLTDFLGTVPGYREPDISLWFLLFFGIFFAMIFGDGGYGGILVILSLIGIVKAKAKEQPAPLAMQMFLYLGILTVIWGTATCNWFGISVNYIPAWLKNLSVPAISNATEESIRNANLMQFCFTLGLIQLTIGHIISIVRNIRSPQVLGHIGSIAMLGGMYVVVLSLVVSAERYQINQPVLIAIGGGFALNFIFSNYQTGIGQSILDSLKNIITMFLGVVNVFADIMSYIRLWAVGLAGSAISATVNQMAGPALGSFLIFLGVLLLFFGHGLNYIMNVLSVIVHGVRLNTLEFSNHVGLTWAGFKYEPFAE